MKMSAIGRAALISREGCVLHAYKDSVGVWTVGVGHTAACGAPIPRAGLTITQAEADAALERDLAAFEVPLTKAIRITVADHEFDALCSLAFNVGVGGVVGSTIVLRLNTGNRIGAAAAFDMWHKPPEIISRRNAERDQFKTPYPKALPKGRSTDAHPVAAPIVVPSPSVAPAPLAPPAPAPAVCPTCHRPLAA